MIDKIKLKSGASKGQPNLEFDLTPITVFVGPNNSGKSKLLLEIESFLGNKRTIDPNNLILEKVTLQAFSEEEITQELEKIKVEQPSESSENPDIITIRTPSTSHNYSRIMSFNLKPLIEEAQDPNNSNHGGYSTFLGLCTLNLNAINRLSLLEGRGTGDLQNPDNPLSFLFTNNDLRKRLREIIYEAFEKYYVIDPTNLGALQIRLSDRAPVDEGEEKGLETRSVKFHKEATPIREFGDGVKAFTGIMTMILAGDPKILLIDEPEAFLHPSLSSKLGKEIGRSLMSSNKKLLVSTHSSSFLMGCVQSGVPLNIVRLTYKNGIATSRILPKEKIIELMRDPLLRSTGVLNGLFFEAVVVTEADSDRVFYQEINERLLSENDPRGIKNCLFINAQNKQTIARIVKPLRELGIPTVGIVDIDVLKEGGQVFTKLLDASFIPSLNQQAFCNQRKSLYDTLNATGKEWKKDGGVELLNGEDKEACSNFFNQLDEYGVFVIRQGELENWLKPLKATRHGTDWLIDIFTKMGDNPVDANYKKPEEGDVWDFIGEINNWISNPNRKGIP